MKVAYFFLSFFSIVISTSTMLFANNFSLHAIDYDSTYSFVAWDSTKPETKIKSFSGDRVYSLLNQTLVVSPGYQKGSDDIDLRAVKWDNVKSRNDKNSIYMCCDSNIYKGNYFQFSAYDKIKNLKFKIINIEKSEYYLPYSANKYNVADITNETFVFTLRPGNGDQDIYYHFHPYYAFIGNFMIEGYIEKVKKDILGKRFVLSKSAFPDGFDEVDFDITDKWTCTEIKFGATELRHKIVLKNKKGSSIEINLRDVFPNIKKYIYPEAKADSFLKKYKKDLWAATLNRELTVGMSAELLLEIWKKPDNKTKSMSGGFSTETWSYDDGSYLTLENGKLTEMFSASSD